MSKKKTASVISFC